MRQTNITLLTVVFVAFLWLLPSLGEAGTKTVDCSKKSLQNAINEAKPEDTVQVINGSTCNENVTIDESKERITLDGQGTATINGPAGSATIQVRGNGITIKNFLSITGGSTGIFVTRGGTATIDNNTIQSTGDVGIIVRQNSYAVIINNTIQNNPESGIVVSQNSSAHIGVHDDEEVASPNTIQTNGGDGIHVERSSDAYIVGNTISSNNGAGGVHVIEVSHAHIAGNTINSNVGDGIAVDENSGVNLGEDSGTGIFEAPNDTTVNNTGFGISCLINGYANGRLGTLKGNGGTKSFSGICVDSLI